MGYKAFALFGVGAAVLVPAVSAATASAQTITTPQACYVDSVNNQVPIPYTVSGFNADSGLDVQAQGSGNSAYYTYDDGNTTNASGDASGQLPGDSLYSTASPINTPYVASVTLSATDDGSASGGAPDTATTSFSIANLGATVNDDNFAHPTQKVTWEESGLPAGAVYVHIVRKKKLLWSGKLGTSSGQCDLVSGRLRMYPAHVHQYAKYTVVFNNAKKSGKGGIQLPFTEESF